MYKNILIPTDGSPLSREAIVSGVKLAKTVRAKITGFFAAPPPTPVVYKNLLPVGYMTPDEHAEVIEKTANQYLNVIRKAAKEAGVRCECLHVTSDFPADAILELANRRRCDLVYMASHARRGIAGALLGSQTQKVLARAKIPVLVHR